MSNTTETVDPPTEVPTDFEAEVRGRLATLQVRTDAEIEAQRAEDKRQRVTQLRREAGLPRRASDWCKELERRAPRADDREWWDDGSKWAQCVHRVRGLADCGTVAVIGPQGCGKTTMAVLIARQMTAVERSVRWTDVVGFIIAMQDAKASGNQQREIREWEAPDLLVIDQADKMPSADWESRLLFRLIDQRYNAKKSTILLCNVEGEDRAEWATQVAGKLGASIFDRIRETGSVELTSWPPLRPDRVEAGGAK